MDKIAEIAGFVILGPENHLDIAYHTFGPTMRAAWERHCGPPRPADPIKINRWRQRGWRPVAVTMRLSEPIPRKHLNGE